MDKAEPIPTSVLDHILAVQLAVAWAGEKGEDPRLGWWRTDLVSEFGGEDLFQRLLPHTWAWAVLQAAREAARRRDAAVRAKDHDPDRMLTLFRLGFAIDERLDERLQDLKRSGRPPKAALPKLGEILAEDWSRKDFEEWVGAHDRSDTVASPAGRRLRGEPPQALDLLVDRLVGALAPMGADYPLPHFRSAR